MAARWRLVALCGCVSLCCCIGFRAKFEKVDFAGIATKQEAEDELSRQWSLALQSDDAGATDDIVDGEVKAFRAVVDEDGAQLPAPIGRRNDQDSGHELRFKEQASGHKESSSGRKEPPRGRKDPARGHKLPASGLKEQTSGRKASGRKEPASGRKEPASGPKSARGRKARRSGRFGPSSRRSKSGKRERIGRRGRTARSGRWASTGEAKSGRKEQAVTMPLPKFGDYVVAIEEGPKLPRKGTIGQVMQVDAPRKLYCIRFEGATEQECIKEEVVQTHFAKTI